LMSRPRQQDSVHASDDAGTDEKDPHVGQVCSSYGQLNAVAKRRSRGSLRLIVSILAGEAMVAQSQRSLLE
jgi:hypothetical protein